MNETYEKLRDEVIQYTSAEIVETLSNDDRLLPNCRVRPQGQRMVRIDNISYIKRDTNEDLVFVNSDLSKGGLTLYFHCKSGVSSWDSWDEVVSQFHAKSDVKGIKPPYVLKWENNSNGGVLKADERFDESTYLKQGISVRPAIALAFEKLLHKYLTTDEDRFNTKEVYPAKIAALYNLDTERVEVL